MDDQKSTTTREEVIRHYHLSDGRLMALQRARMFSAVQIYQEEGRLYAGTLEIVLKTLMYLRDNLSTTDLPGLMRFVDDLGAHFPGVYLYDFLVRNGALIPLFPPDTMIVFLGSRAVCSTGQKTTQEEVRVSPTISTQPSGLWATLKNLSWKKKAPVPLPASVPPAATPSKPDAGYLAFRRNIQGNVEPWFLSQQELMHAITEGDNSIFVVYAREPK